LVLTHGVMVTLLILVQSFMVRIHMGQRMDSETRYHSVFQLLGEEFDRSCNSCFSADKKSSGAGIGPGSCSFISPVAGLKVTTSSLFLPLMYQVSVTSVDQYK
jgi:hypothetical protein